MANVYERQGLLQEAIKDAEWRLGSYLAMEGCEKTDLYAKSQIDKINAWSEELDNFLKGVSIDG